MKLGKMDFRQTVSLLLLVLFVVPLKSESPEDASQEDNEDGSDNDFEKESPEDPDQHDNKDEFDNNSPTNVPEDPNQKKNEDESDNVSPTKSPEDPKEQDNVESPEDPKEEDNKDESVNDPATKSPDIPNLQDNGDESDNDDATESLDDHNQEDNEENDSATDTTESVIPVSNTENATMTTSQTRPDGMEMALSGQDGVKDGQGETDIAVKVGVPVALLGLVITLGIIRVVTSGQLKNRVLGLGRLFGKIPEKSFPLYSSNGSSSGKVTNEMFVNPTYAVQNGHDTIQSECMSPAGCGQDTMEQGLFVYDNPEELKNDSDATYQTIADGQLNPSFASFARSNGQPPAIPQRQYDETAYNNTYI